MCQNNNKNARLCFSVRSRLLLQNPFCHQLVCCFLASPPPALTRRTKKNVFVQIKRLFLIGRNHKPTWHGNRVIGELPPLIVQSRDTCFSNEEHYNWQIPMSPNVNRSTRINPNISKYKLANYIEKKRNQKISQLPLSLVSFEGRMNSR